MSAVPPGLVTVTARTTVCYTRAPHCAGIVVGVGSLFDRRVRFRRSAAPASTGVLRGEHARGHLADQKTILI
jgi:hypothetical protein